MCLFPMTFPLRLLDMYNSNLDVVAWDLLVGIEEKALTLVSITRALNKWEQHRNMIAQLVVSVEKKVGWDRNAIIMVGVLYPREKKIYVNRCSSPGNVKFVSQNLFGAVASDA